jgi:hypothetical protein
MTTNKINLTQLTDKAVAAIVALPYRTNEYSYSGKSRLPRSRRSVSAILKKVENTLLESGFTPPHALKSAWNIVDIAELEINGEEAE